MKQCPRCRKNYSDDDLNFCLDDGELLTAFGRGPLPTGYADEPPPTVLLDQSRVTNPASWPASPPAPVAQWQSSNVPQPFGQYARLSPDQTLAVVSLCLGIGSITVGWCCYLGVLLSPAALITGFIALAQINKDPNRYGGRGIAFGGIATGAVFVVGFILYLIFIVSLMASG